MSVINRLLELKQEPALSNEIEKILSLSGNHICYWEFNLKTKMYRESSAYESLDRIQFCDFMWPKSFLTEDNWSLYQESMNKLIEENKTLDMSFEFKSLKKWFRIVTRFSQERGVFEGVIKDITSEYKTETALRNRTIELSSCDEGLDNFTIVARTDPKGKIIYANKEFCRLSKYSYEELIGKDHRLLNSGHHPKEFFVGMWRAIENGESWRGIIKNIAKDGTHYWVDTVIIPIRDDHGVLIEILSFRFDVTQLQTYKEENALLKRQIEELMLKKDVGTLV